MNERIKELHNRACRLDMEQYPNAIPDGERIQQKFAELIVKECVGILMKPEYAMNHPGELADYNRGWVNGRLLGIEHIEEYFGVEQ
jgi:hypothetical protein